MLQQECALLDLLVCPKSKSPLSRVGDALQSAEGLRYPLLDGVPILRDTSGGEVRHEGPLEVWSGYEPTIAFMLDSLPPNEVILDLGSGNRALDNPRIIRSDICLTAHVDVVADAHALPFKDNSIGMVYATAVFEHLHSPWVAAQEIWRVLKPGGYALVDCNFVFPFHGFPAVYFNASAEGLRRLFCQFTELQVMAAPWQMPSFTIETVLGEYLRFFKAESAEELRFAEALKNLRHHPLRSFDARFAQADAQRIAAAVTYFGTKQPEGSETLLPAPLLHLWQRDTALQARYERPADLLPSNEAPMSNLLHWAATDGRAVHPDIDVWYRACKPFSKGRFVP